MILDPLCKVLSDYSIVQNCINFKKEKECGATSKDYTFHLNKIKLRKKVLAAYKDGGKAKKDQSMQGFENGVFLVEIVL